MKKILLMMGIAVVAVFLFFIFRSNNSSDVINANADIIYFHGKGCPHCEIVQEFIDKNSVGSKIAMESSEVFFNKENQKIFQEKARACNIPEDQMGVPLLWVKGKCYTGDKEIISYFEEQLKTVNSEQ